MELGTYLEDELERIKQELKSKGKLNKYSKGAELATEDQLTVSYLISLYEATKGLIA